MYQNCYCLGKNFLFKILKWNTWNTSNLKYGLRIHSFLQNQMQSNECVDEQIIVLPDVCAWEQSVAAGLVQVIYLHNLFHLKSPISNFLLLYNATHIQITHIPIMKSTIFMKPMIYFSKTIKKTYIIGMSLVLIQQYQKINKLNICLMLLNWIEIALQH